eukprot:tig00021374_g21115.t1
MSRRRSAPAVADIQFDPQDYKYHTHLCGCCDDIETCVPTCFCPQLQLGMNEWRFARRTPPGVRNADGGSAGPCGAVVRVNTCALICCMDLFSLGLATCICTMLNRSKYRRHYGDTKGGDIDDCCRAFCCNMCTICQDARELKLRRGMADVRARTMRAPQPQPQTVAPLAMYAPQMLTMAPPPHSDPPSTHSLHASQLNYALPGSISIAAPQPQPQLVMQAPAQQLVLPAPQFQIASAPPPPPPPPPPQPIYAFAAPQPQLVLQAPQPPPQPPQPQPLIGARDVARFGSTSGGVLTTSTATNSYHPRGGAGIVHPSGGGSNAMLTTTYAIYPQYHALQQQQQQQQMQQQVQMQQQQVQMVAAAPAVQQATTTTYAMVPTITPARQTITSPISPVPFPSL